MLVRIRPICMLVKPNNGIVRLMFTSPAHYSDDKSQEDHALFNLHGVDASEFERGRPYVITIERGFPR